MKEPLPLLQPSCCKHVCHLCLTYIIGCHCLQELRDQKVIKASLLSMIEAAIYIRQQHGGAIFEFRPQETYLMKKLDPYTAPQQPFSVYGGYRNLRFCDDRTGARGSQIYAANAA